MRDLQMVARDCMSMLDCLKIPYCYDVRFTVNTRAKKRWGQCIRRVNGSYDININVILLDESTDIRGLENTILHELLHTCEGCMNHGAIWKKYAEMVYKAYGYNVKRTSDAYEKGVAGAEKSEPVSRKKRRTVIYTIESVMNFVNDVHNDEDWNVYQNGKDFICVCTGKYKTMVFRYVEEAEGYSRSCRNKVSDNLRKEIKASEKYKI